MSNILVAGLRALSRRRQAGLGRAREADVNTMLDGAAIALLDVGASGGIISRWEPFRASIEFIGVEPDERSIQGLMESAEAKTFRSYKIIPSGVWSHSGRLGISFTRKPTCSSHFKPNTPFLSRFQDAERFDVTGSTEIECLTVDDLMARRGKRVDFIKLDLEGGEVAVLEGAVDTLRSCMGLHVEVSFQSIREKQPLFGDVARLLYEQGLEFIDFVALIRWERLASLFRRVFSHYAGYDKALHCIY